MTAEHDFLASAYLDGELSDDERRAAEADPAVMAEVESLRALRARLSDVEPPSDAARERAIAAAMNVFAERGTATPPEATTLSAFDRRRNSTRWLGAAAAVVVVGMLGVVLASGLGGDDTDDAATDTADEPAFEAVEEATAVTMEAADDDEASDAADAADGGEGEGAGDERSTQAVGELEEADSMLATADAERTDDAADESTVAADAAQEPAAAGSGAMVDMRDPEEYLDGHPIETADELQLVAQFLLELVDERELPPTPNHSCPFPDVLARGVFDDPDDADPPIEIYISVNPASGVVEAIDQDTCRVIFETELDS